jgi:predicted amino acid-binding ACT domain protein
MEGLEQIKKIIKDEIEDLAQIVNKGFIEMQKQINSVRDELKSDINSVRDELKSDINYLDANIKVIRQDIAEIKLNFVYRHEFEDLMARVKYLETKIGIESGK